MVKISLPIEGMHCRSCEITIGDHLMKVPRVISADVSLKTQTATIEAVSPPNHSDLVEAVRAAGYDVGTKKKPWFSRNPKDYKDFIFSLAVIGVLGLAFLLFNLDKAIPVGSITSGGPAVALFTGLVAGISTCMALVGGLVLGLSARHAKKHPTATPAQKFRPHIFFNISRIVSFFILGGLIGLLGASVQLQGAPLGVLMIIVGTVMFLLGLQLTNIMPRVSAGGFTLPTGISKALGLKKHSEKEYSHNSALALGAISFFLPCGFTQVMQLYAMSTGSFIEGALVMGLFAIGTAPGLIGIGGLTSFIKSKTTGKFFKFAGVAVMAFALINVNNGYNLTGFQMPSFNFSKPAAKVDTKLHTMDTVYTLKDDIIPSTFTAKSYTSHSLIVDSKDDGTGCMSTIMIPGLFNTPLYLKKGEKQVLNFMTKGPGTYKITCAMGIPRGTFTVI